MVQATPAVAAVLAVEAPEPLTPPSAEVEHLAAALEEAASASEPSAPALSEAADEKIAAKVEDIKAQAAAVEVRGLVDRLTTMPLQHKRSGASPERHRSSPIACISKPQCCP